MSFNPNITQQAQLVEVLGRPRQKLTASERLAEAAAFILATTALWIAWQPHGFKLWPALVCMALLSLSTRVRFDTPFGFTVATQLAFVPLLFAMPVALVPVAVVVSLTAAAVPEVFSRDVRPSRLIVRIGNA